MSSELDFDPDETMASQQTAATELTQPLPSVISRVGLPNLTTVRKLADDDSMPKRCVYDYGLPISKFRRIRQTYLSPSFEPQGMKAKIHRCLQTPTLAKTITHHYPHYSQHQCCAQRLIQRVPLHPRILHLLPRALSTTVQTRLLVMTSSGLLHYHVTPRMRCHSIPAVRQKTRSVAKGVMMSVVSRAALFGVKLRLGC